LSLIDKYILLLIYGILIILKIVSYYKYGVKTYILPDDFAKIGKDLPYKSLSGNNLTFIKYQTDKGKEKANIICCWQSLTYRLQRSSSMA
jgi:hypothetical protein